MKQSLHRQCGWKFSPTDGEKNWETTIAGDAQKTARKKKVSDAGDTGNNNGGAAAASVARGLRVHATVQIADPRRVLLLPLALLREERGLLLKPSRLGCV